MISLPTLTILGFYEDDSILRGETTDQPLFPGRVAPLPRGRSFPAPRGKPGRGRPAFPPRRHQPVRAPLGRAGQRRALGSAGRQRRPSRSPLGPLRAPIAPTPPARPRFRPPPPRGIPRARRRPRRLRGSQQTPRPGPANGCTPLPEGERRPRRLSGQGGGREEGGLQFPACQRPPPRPAGHSASAARAGSARPWLGLAPAPSGRGAATGGVRACSGLAESWNCWRWKGPPEIIQAQPLPRQGHHEQCYINVSRWDWNTFREGDSATSLVSQFQCSAPSV